MDEFYDFKEKNYYESLRKCHSLLQLKILELVMYRRCICVKGHAVGRGRHGGNALILGSEHHGQGHGHLLRPVIYSGNQMGVNINNGFFLDR